MLTPSGVRVYRISGASTGPKIVRGRPRPRPGAGGARSGSARRPEAHVRATAASHGELQPASGLLQPEAKVLAELVGADDLWPVRWRSGAEGTRTPGLRRATPALSQLSYSPFELVVGGKGNTRSLPVGRCSKPKIDPSSALNQRDRKQEAAIPFAAVDG